MIIIGCFAILVLVFYSIGVIADDHARGNIKHWVALIATASLAIGCFSYEVVDRKITAEFKTIEVMNLKKDSEIEISDYIIQSPNQECNIVKKIKIQKDNNFFSVARDDTDTILVIEVVK